MGNFRFHFRLVLDPGPTHGSGSELGLVYLGAELGSGGTNLKV